MARERCPQCQSRQPLAERTNGDGRCYLECNACGYIESVTRKSDPYPSRRSVRKGCERRWLSSRDYLREEEQLLRAASIPSTLRGGRPRKAL